MTTKEELQARVAAAKAAAAKAVLTDEEQEIADLHAQEQAAIEEAAAHEAARRAIALKDRERAAESEAGNKYLVQGVDLVALFPLGKAPMDLMPSGGTIVVRSPTKEAADTVAREVEAKRQPLHAILANLLASSSVDPKEHSADHMKLQKWAEKYPEAATAAANVVRKLGGAKLAEDKRGRG